MARGGRKTPPPPNRSPIVTRSYSFDSIPPRTATTSTEDPQIIVEPTATEPPSTKSKVVDDPPMRPNQKQKGVNWKQQSPNTNLTKV